MLQDSVQKRIEVKEEDKMIDEKKLIEIGRILKPRGVKGELTVLFNNAQYADIDTNYYFFSLDGMYVPFFVEEFMYNSDVTARIVFKGIDSVEKAATYSNIHLFVPDKFIQDIVGQDEHQTEWHRFIGYTVYDKDSSIIGTIESIDSSTINTLFVILSGDKEVLIPATPDFIEKEDAQQKQLYLQLPEGLLEDSLE